MRMVMTIKKYFLPTSHRAADVSKSAVQVQFMAFNQGEFKLKQVKMVCKTFGFPSISVQS